MKAHWICDLFYHVPRFQFLCNLVESWYPVMSCPSFCGTWGLVTRVENAVQWEKLLVFSVFYCKMLLVNFKNAKFQILGIYLLPSTVPSFFKSS